MITGMVVLVLQELLLNDSKALFCVFIVFLDGLHDNFNNVLSTVLQCSFFA